jgi:hypothetical protein
LTSVERIAEYLASLKLAGRQQALAALELWSTNRSPSEIEVVTGLPKNRVRGYIRRVCEKAANPRRAAAIARALLPMVRGIEPIRDNGRCRICGAYVGDSYTAAMHVKGSQKPCEWAYLSTETLQLLQRYAGRSINRSVVTRYAKKHRLLAPKMMRKASWRIMVQVMPREIARFIQSRFGEIKISEARYEDLLSEADTHYPKYLEKLREIVYSSLMQENES